MKNGDVLALKAGLKELEQTSSVLPPDLRDVMAKNLVGMESVLAFYEFLKEDILSEWQEQMKYDAQKAALDQNYRNMMDATANAYMRSNSIYKDWAKEMSDFKPTEISTDVLKGLAMYSPDVVGRCSAIFVNS